MHACAESGGGESSVECVGGVSDDVTSAEARRDSGISVTSSLQVTSTCYTSELPAVSQHAAILEEPAGRHRHLSADVSDTLHHHSVTDTQPAVLPWIGLSTGQGCSFDHCCCINS